VLRDWSDPRKTTPSELQRFLGLLCNEFERTLKNAISLQ
jgi:hypothetical protein